MTKAPCPFCGLDDPDMTIFSTDLVQAVVSKNPVNDYHVIVIPRVHAERLPDLPPEFAAAAIHAAQRVARAILRAAAPDGITYITEDDITGVGYNLVPHWKLHIIARYGDDGVRIKWARGDVKEPEVRVQIAAALRAHLPPSE